MFEINYNFNDVPTVKAFIQCKKQIKFIMGALGSGKSSGCVMHLLHYMVQQKPNSKNVRKTRYAVIRNTNKQLYDTTKKTIDDWIPKPLFTWKEAKSMYVFNFALEDGTTVYSEWLLRALDEPEQVRDLLSMELTGAWINEAREIDEEIFKALRGRIGRYPPQREGGASYPYIIMDSNPPDTEHWLYHFFEVLAREDEKVAGIAQIFKQPSGLSPEAENINNLPPNYYENLCIGQDEDFIRVYVHGEYGFVKAGRPVFVAYKDTIHCASEPIKPIRTLPLVIGMDFGLYPACVFVQITPDGRLFVLNELVSTEPVDVETFVKERLLPFYNEHYFMFNTTVIGDPAGKSRSQVDSRSCFAVLRSYNFLSYPAPTNSLHDRIKAVNYFLTRNIKDEPAFKLSPTCKFLRKALNGEYHFRRLRVAGERYSEVPEKNIFSHVADALQYACLSYSPAFRNEIDNYYGGRRYIENQQPAKYGGFV